MSKKFCSWTMVCILIAGGVVFSGCGKKSEERTAEKMTEKILKESTGKDMKVNIEGKNIKIEGEGSKAEISEANAWPADMFEAVPKFSGGKIDRVTRTQEGTTQNFNLFFVDVQEDAVKGYETLLKEKGWQIQLVDMGTGMMISAQKDKLGLNFSYTREGKRGTIAVFTAQ
jgi:hypothetical protein